MLSRIQSAARSLSRDHSDTQFRTIPATEEDIQRSLGITILKFKPASEIDSIRSVPIAQTGETDPQANRSRSVGSKPLDPPAQWPLPKDAQSVSLLQDEDQPESYQMEQIGSNDDDDDDLKPNEDSGRRDRVAPDAMNQNHDDIHIDAADPELEVENQENKVEDEENEVEDEKRDVEDRENEIELDPATMSLKDKLFPDLKTVEADYLLPTDFPDDRLIGYDYQIEQNYVIDMYYSTNHLFEFNHARSTYLILLWFLLQIAVFVVTILYRDDASKNNRALTLRWLILQFASIFILSVEVTGLLVSKRCCYDLKTPKTFVNSYIYEHAYLPIWIVLVIWYYMQAHALKRYQEAVDNYSAGKAAVPHVSPYVTTLSINIPCQVCWLATGFVVNYLYALPTKIEPLTRIQNIVEMGFFGKTPIWIGPVCHIDPPDVYKYVGNMEDPFNTILMTSLHELHDYSFRSVYGFVTINALTTTSIGVAAFITVGSTTVPSILDPNFNPRGEPELARGTLAIYLTLLFYNTLVTIQAIFKVERLRRYLRQIKVHLNTKLQTVSTERTNLSEIRAFLTSVMEVRALLINMVIPVSLRYIARFFSRVFFVLLLIGVIGSSVFIAIWKTLTWESILVYGFLLAWIVNWMFVLAMVGRLEGEGKKHIQSLASWTTFLSRLRSDNPDTMKLRDDIVQDIQIWNYKILNADTGITVSIFSITTLKVTNVVVLSTITLVLGLVTIFFLRVGQVKQLF